MSLEIPTVASLVAETAQRHQVCPIVRSAWIDRTGYDVVDLACDRAAIVAHWVGLQVRGTKPRPSAGAQVLGNIEWPGEHLGKWRTMPEGLHWWPFL